jgi:phosphoserine phosphatase RsbU/P
VQFLDLTTEPTIAPLLAMLRRMTRLGTSKDVLGEFMGQYSRVRPIDAFVGVVHDVRGGGFRVTYAVKASDAVQGFVPHTRDMRPEVIEQLTLYPLACDAFFSAAMADEMPKMIYGIGEIAVPEVARVTAGLGSCMVLPIYVGDGVFEWTFAFSRVPEGAISPRDVAQAVMVANLLGAANRQSDLVEEVRLLHDALREQIDGIARVQQSLLPDRLPTIARCSVASSYLTSDAAGGDYYDFFPLPGGEWGVLIADVSGHGPAAATVMAMLHAILHSRPPEERVDPRRVMVFANERLHAARLDGSFVTAFFAVLNPTTGTVRYCNCGHNPPRIAGAAGACDALTHGATIPLGILPELIEPECTAIQLSPGDRLVLYTDGITEAFDSLGVMFGESGLDGAIAGKKITVDETIDAIHAGLYKHHGLKPRADDQTVVVIEWAGP